MSNLYITIPSAVIPAVLLLLYFIKNDRYPEPTHLLTKTFIMGFMISAPILLVAKPAMYYLESLQLSPFWEGVVISFLVASIPEESFKFLVLKRYCSTQKEFNEPMDAIVYGAVVSLGFATIENILYVSSGDLDIAIKRALTAVPAHASFGAFMGYYYAKSHFSKTSTHLTSWPTLLIPIMLHGLYNIPPLWLEASSNQNQPLSSGLVLFFILGMVNLKVFQKK